MNEAINVVLKIQPDVRQCVWGGWLAVSPEGSRIGIGVLGSTEEEAKCKFSEALAKWAELLNKHDMETDLKTHVEHLHSCRVLEYLGSTDVDERFEGSPVWQGTVHSFSIEGHPEATICYAWSSPIEGSDKRKFYAVLHKTPVDSPQTAVRASIMADPV